MIETEVLENILVKYRTIKEFSALPDSVLGTIGLELELLLQ
ncbi:MAG: hypothetical protein AB2421_20075 [Thermotaleaceae bacterium]